MKLTMQDQMTFQRVSGYPEDPEYMTDEQVREHLRYWADSLDELLAKKSEGSVEELDLELLATFLESLTHADIEYTEPYKEFEFSVQFKCYKQLKIAAKTQDEANAIAESLIKNELRENLASATLDVVELEEYGSWNIIDNYVHETDIPGIGKRLSELFD